MWVKTYSNGSVHVIIKGDGTKIRHVEGLPAKPESIDLKITDYCDAGCKYCHESSTTRGRHGYTEFILNIIDQMIPGTELAIGGGNPLSHPDLEDILLYADRKGIITNVTVNEYHIDSLLDRDSYDVLNIIRGGIGISLSTKPNIDKIKELWNTHDHVVFHMIHKIHTKAMCMLLAKKIQIPKVLILGYKEFGFGIKYKKDIDLDSYYAERDSCGLAFTDKYLRRSIDFSFDNLALEQLRVKEWMTKNNWMTHDEWNERYMGDDGTYTMYIDAVKEQYAVSSTSKREPWNKEIDLKKSFDNIRFNRK